MPIRRQTSYPTTRTNQLSSQITTIGPDPVGDAYQQEIAFAYNGNAVTGETVTNGYADNVATDGTPVKGENGLYWHTSATAAQTQGSSSFGYGNTGDLELMESYDAAGNPTGATYYRYYGSGGAEPT